MGGNGQGEIVATPTPVVTVVARAVSVASATFTQAVGAIFFPFDTVGHFIPRADLAHLHAVVAASIAFIVSSVAFVASPGANDNGSGSTGGDFEKPLDMLLEDEMELSMMMWKEKQYNSIDEEAQEGEILKWIIRNRIRRDGQK